MTAIMDLRTREMDDSLVARYRVLVVEDAPAQRNILRDNFTFYGFDCVAVSSAEEALVKAPLTRPHLALIDIGLPGMDGVVLTSKFRANPATSRIPVVLLTGLQVPIGVVEAIAAGLGRIPIVEKPYEFAELKRLVDGLLQSPARGRIIVDEGVRQAWIDGKLVALPEKMFDLLAVLAKTKEPILRGDLRKRVWPGLENLSTVNEAVGRLRVHLDPFDIGIEPSSRGFYLTTPEDA